MAQLKDTIVLGDLRVTDTLSSNRLELTTPLSIAYGGTGISVSSHNANRFVWSTSGSAIQASGSHYIDNTKIAVNSTSAPTTNFYVSGTAMVNGGTTKLVNTTAASTTIGSSQLIVSSNGGNTVGIELDRTSSKTCWQISNNNGALQFKTNYTTGDVVNSTYTETILTLSNSSHEVVANAFKATKAISSSNPYNINGVAKQAYELTGTLDVSKLTGTLDVSKGGTGKTSLHGAYSNLQTGLYFECNTPAGTATKTITISQENDFILTVGTKIKVKFSATNTVASPTLNIVDAADSNISTGAKQIWYKGLRVKSKGLQANVIYDLLYDGTYWQIQNDFQPIYYSYTDVPLVVAGTDTTAHKNTLVMAIDGFIPYEGAKLYIRFSPDSTAELITKGGLYFAINSNTARQLAYINTPDRRVSGSHLTISNYYYEFIYYNSRYWFTGVQAPILYTLGVTADANNNIAEVHGTQTLVLGNATNSTTTNGLTGCIQLYNSKTKPILISAKKNTETANATTAREYFLPNLSKNAYFGMLGAGTGDATPAPPSTNTEYYPLHLGNNCELVSSYLLGGATRVTLNGTTKYATSTTTTSLNDVTASFYAPTEAPSGLSILRATNSTTAPSWLAATTAGVLVSSGSALSFGSVPIDKGGTGLTGPGSNFGTGTSASTKCCALLAYKRTSSSNAAATAHYIYATYGDNDKYLKFNSSSNTCTWASVPDGVTITNYNKALGNNSWTDTDPNEVYITGYSGTLPGTSISGGSLSATSYVRMSRSGTITANKLMLEGWYNSQNNSTLKTLELALGTSNNGSTLSNISLYLGDSSVYVYWPNASSANGVLMGAAWNDYAEYRCSITNEPGYCVQENDSGIMTKTSSRLIPGVSIISDTYGFAQGETADATVPVAVAGRVLAYPYRDRTEYHAGMAVCSAPNGTVDIMTREEIMQYPDCIIGYVSEVPTGTIWGPNAVLINNRIWIKVK